MAERIPDDITTLVRQMRKTAISDMAGYIDNDTIARALYAERKRAADYHVDLAAQHEAALTDDDIEGNAWHLAQSVAHRKHATAILASKGGGNG